MCETIGVALVIVVLFIAGWEWIDGFADELDDNED